MTRFWITLEQGVDFVLNCFKTMIGGELFIPKLPSMNIMDLAKVIAPECKTNIVGIRPGEKLHEVMIPKDDAIRTIEYADHYIIQPYFDFWERRFTNNGGQSVPEEFEYNSGDNPWILTPDQMREIIENL